MNILRNSKMKITLSLITILATIFLVYFISGNFKFTSAKEGTNKDTSRVTEQQKNSKPEQENNPKPEQPVAREKGPDGKPVGKVVYLTFDDGPSTLTGKFLDILKDNNVKGTFFMIGNNLKQKEFQENVKRAIKEGHYIGGHSMTHDSKKLYNEGQFVPEMKEVLSLIHTITGEHPKLVRPPYGSAPGLKSQQIRDQTAEAGIKVWDWTIDSEDWKLKNNPNQIIENVKKGTTKNVEVILMHEKAQTLQVLPEIIKFYKEQGYEFEVYRDIDHFHLNFQKDDRL